ncbi:hypothetical protein [Streptomyces subrutilus]|uniref:hypothetical protein n=1 Tax=Streptomyces subrutilus TaxID=36818 RepID=UPI002E0DFA11|nr:hypothetical protein OG479_32805 [Streptomyces subrutilus]
MTAHPPRVRWHVETYDPLAAEWSSGTCFTGRQTAVEAIAHRDERYPKWADGTPVQRRIVVEITTFQDMTGPAPIPRFPKGGFIYTDHAGQDLGAVPGQTPDGRPALRLLTGSEEVGHAEATIPLDRLEEIIAGLRETGRPAAGPERVKLHVALDPAEFTAAIRAAVRPRPPEPEDLR